jgi:hypothetical protein
MSFITVDITSDPFLDEMLERALNIPTQAMVNLSLYEVNINIHWAEFIKGGNIIDVRPATQVESKRLGIDAVVAVSKEDTMDYDEKSFEALIAAIISRITPVFRGKSNIPMIVIEKNYYELSEDIVSYYGKDVKYSEDFFEKVDNLEDDREQYKDKDRVKKGSFEESISAR